MDIAIIVIYLAAMLAFGFWGKTRTKNSKDFLVAGRRLGPAFYTGTMAAVLGRTYNASAGEPDWAGYQYIMVQPTRDDDVARVAITRNRFEEESGINRAPEINDGVEHYIAVTVNSTDLAFYLDGSLVATAPLGENTLDKLSNDLAYLGRSVYQFDPYFVGSINEFRIWGNALSADQIAAQFDAGPNVVVPEPSAAALLGLSLLGLAFRRRA